MIVSADQLVHLTGYAAIAVVLASASWAGTIGAFVGYTFALAVAVLLVRAWVESVRRRFREDAEQFLEDRQSTATDGGFEWGDG